MDIDWHRLRAVVLQSDDWGLCAWVPDERAHRALADGPAFRSAPGQRYGRSTLESADDVRALAGVLESVRGGDGLPAVWQANTIVANPDFEALVPPQFAGESLPLRAHPALPTRWERPGLWDAVRDAERAGLWWAELHGLHHLPARAWLQALRRGDDEARHAHSHASPICAAVEASGEYDPAEPIQARAEDLATACAHFRALLGRDPSSFCPPDYRFDDWLEAQAASHSIRVLQGKPEQHGRRFARMRRWLAARRFPEWSAGMLRMPPRIAFEPLGEAEATGRRGIDAAVRRAAQAWSEGRPAVISSHRLNYAHLDAPWSAAGRQALGALLTQLAALGARFMTDIEVRQLVESRWSVRVGRDGAVLRHMGPPHEPLRFAVPPAARRVRFEGASEPAGATLQSESGMAEARVDVGEYRIVWE